MINGFLSGFGLALPAGLNAYIPLLILALTDRFSHVVDLQSPYDKISSAWGIALIMLLLLIELIADKIPVVDHMNDVVQTVIRPAAGALLMLAETQSAAGHINPVVAAIIGLLGAGAVHGAKATVRPAVTISSGGMANPFVSMIEDAVATVTSIVAVVLPFLIILLVPVFAWLLWMLYQRIRRGLSIFKRLDERQRVASNRLK
jgi:uncharacterized membrane protein